MSRTPDALITELLIHSRRFGCDGIGTPRPYSLARLAESLSSALIDVAAKL